MITFLAVGLLVLALLVVPGLAAHARLPVGRQRRAPLEQALAAVDALAEGGQNAASVASAIDLVLAGTDATAADTGSAEVASLEARFGAGFVPIDARDLAAHVRTLSDGARALVLVCDGSCRHVFNAFVQRGRPRYADGITGTLTEDLDDLLDAAGFAPAAVAEAAILVTHPGAA